MYVIGKLSKYNDERRVVQYSQIDSIGISGDKKGVHWYTWQDQYQQKIASFQQFYWLLCIPLRGLRLFSYVAWWGTGQFRQSIGTGLVPIENDVIPVVLLVNMHLIKGTQIILDMCVNHSFSLAVQWNTWVRN